MATLFWVKCTWAGAIARTENAEGGWKPTPGSSRRATHEGRGSWWQAADLDRDISLSVVLSVLSHMEESRLSGKSVTTSGPGTLPSAPNSSGHSGCHLLLFIRLSGGRWGLGKPLETEVRHRPSVRGSWCFTGYVDVSQCFMWGPP